VVVENIEPLSSKLQTEPLRELEVLADGEIGVPSAGSAESISAVMNGAGKVVTECVIETKASMIPQFIDRLRGGAHGWTGYRKTKRGPGRAPF
jgi:hypothetical protein